MIPAETPVSFRNRRGQKLFGILHTPPSARHDIAILLLSPGIKMRVGPGCLYRHMTDVLVRLGFPVLRFDFYGIVDSEGRHSETLLADVYNHMEVGRFVEDTLDAMDWMQDRYGYTRFLLSGLCGGAVTGLLAGSRDPRVAGLLSLGITPVFTVAGNTYNWRVDFPNSNSPGSDRFLVWDTATWSIVVPDPDTWDFNMLHVNAFLNGESIKLERCVRGADCVPTTPIPEPSTYALMLAGLGVVGWMARRRRPV